VAGFSVCVGGGGMWLLVFGRMWCGGDWEMEAQWGLVIGVSVQCVREGVEGILVLFVCGWVVLGVGLVNGGWCLEGCGM